MASHAENSRNRSGPNRNNKTSNYLGVSWVSRDGIFIAQIRAGGKILNLGRFKTQAEAAEARAKAEIEMWGVQPRRSDAL